MENHGNPSIKEFETSLIVDVNQQTRKFEKLYKKISQFENPVHSGSAKIQKILNSLFKNNLFLPQLPGQILSIPGFKEYKSCHVLLQERGNTTVDHFFSREGANFKSIEMDANTFHKIFTLIKKSKNRTFSQTSMPNFDIKLVGSFLANCTSLKTHNFILIISRNDFLQPSLDEINAFDDFFQALPGFIEKALRHSVVEEKLNYYKNALQLLPIPFEILNSSNEIISRNFHDKNSVTLKQSLSLNHGYKVHFYQLSGDQTPSELFHHQRVSLLGELLNTLRHELNNPLFGMKLTSDLLIHETNDEEQKSILKEISQNITRSQNIMDNFTNLYTNSDVYQNCTLKKILDESLVLAKSEIRQVKVSQYFKDDLFPEFKIYINQTSMVQIFFNLIVNSSQAMRQASTTNPSIIFNFKHEADTLIIEIMDNGPGIPPEIQKTLFEPFFTTKPNGTGLGLSITMTLVRHLQGDIIYKNNEFGGALFILVFPFDKIQPPNLKL